MVKDYRACQSKWTRGVIQDRIGPVTYQVQVGDLFWKRHLNQLRSIAGSKVADQFPTDQTDPEHLDPLPSLIPQQSRQRPKVLSCDPASSTPDSPSPVPDFPSPAPPALRETCKCHSEEKTSPCQTSMSHPQSSVPTASIENNSESPQVKRYPTRVRLRPKRLIEEIWR